eukprot:6311990-Prymnesium_polylepis.1
MCERCGRVCLRSILVVGTKSKAKRPNAKDILRFSFAVISQAHVNDELYSRNEPEPELRQN